MLNRIAFSAIFLRFSIESRELRDSLMIEFHNQMHGAIWEFQMLMEEQVRLMMHVHRYQFEVV